MTWTFAAEWVAPTIPSPAVMSWSRWKSDRILPYEGGWLDQPLELLVQMMAVDTTYTVWKNKMDDDHQWAKFTANERQLIAVIEQELSGAEGNA